MWNNTIWMLLWNSLKDQKYNKWKTFILTKLYQEKPLLLFFIISGPLLRDVFSFHSWCIISRNVVEHTNQVTLDTSHVTRVSKFSWNSHKLELSVTLKGPYYFDYVCMPFSIDGIANSCDWISVKVCFRRNWSPVKKEKSKSSMGYLVFSLVLSHGTYRLA